NVRTKFRNALSARPRLFGVIFVMLAGAGYGTGPWFAKNLERNGANPMGFLTARFVVSAAILLAVRLIHMRGVKWPNSGDAIKIFSLGAYGFFISPLLYFIALHDLDSGLVVVIFYIYPAIAVLLSWMIYKHKPNLVITICLFTTLTGVWLTAGQVGNGNLRGITMTLFSAITHAIYVVAAGSISKKADPLTMLTIALTGAASAFVLVSLVGPKSLEPKFPVNSQGWLLVLAMAFLITIVATALFFAGIKRIGPGITSMVETFEAVVTISIGVLLMSETVTAIQILGSVTVLGSIVAIGLAESSAESKSGRHPDSHSGTVLDLPIS
ncbi:MAG: DMT family transporter, partial [Actinobacteria bacterium]|nr:DMT family transporter [Actinomycetota bacterium]